MQVHVNGFVSLDRPLFPSWWPYFDRRHAVIAPFWSDFDIRWTDGVVYLGQYRRLSQYQLLTPKADAVFTAVTNLVMTGAGDSGFLPTEVAVVTWQDVRPYPAYWSDHLSQVKST